MCRNVLVAIVLFCQLPGALLASEPLIVHEWGVQSFDWTANRLEREALPEWMYTDARPGKVLPLPEKPVKLGRPDSGLRTKPLLYFYPTRSGLTRNTAKVSIDVRFEHGHAIAWYPQVHRYRTAAMSAAAGPPDWDAWIAKRTQALGLSLDQVRMTGRTAEGSPLYVVNRMPETNLGSPPDERMQLVWEELTVSTDPRQHEIEFQAVPKSSWIHRARDVDSAQVSNGSEAEQFVFYEGKTSELPTITILPPHRYFTQTRREPDPNHYVINTGKHPIHDVLVMYRSKNWKVAWCACVSRLLPAERLERDPRLYAPGRMHALPHIPCVVVPDLNGMKEAALTEEEFVRKTRDRLFDSLTEGDVYPRLFLGNPGFPQPPTVTHQLYDKEANGLLDIWNEEFFKQEGLTVIYREDPAALDAAMPLKIHASNDWRVVLNRCGLVVNQRIPFGSTRTIIKALSQTTAEGAIPPPGKRLSASQKATWTKVLAANPIFALTLADYRGDTRSQAPRDRIEREESWKVFLDEIRSHLR